MLGPEITATVVASAVGSITVKFTCDCGKSRRRKMDKSCKGCYVDSKCTGCGATDTVKI